MLDPRKGPVAAPAGSDESGAFPEQDALFNNLVARSVTVRGSSPYLASAAPGALDGAFHDWGGTSWNVRSSLNPAGPAKGDGVTDDAAAWRAGITAAVAAGSGGVVEGPSSAYALGSNLALNHGVTLRAGGAGISAATYANYYGTFQSPQMAGSAAGARFTWTGAANGTMISCSSKRSAGLQHISLDGNGTAGIGLDLVSAFECTFEDVTVERCQGSPGYGVRLAVASDAANNNCDFNQFENLQVYDCPHGLYLAGGATGAARVTLNQFTNTLLTTSATVSRGITVLQYTDTNWWFGVKIFATANSATAYGIVINDTGTPTAQVGADGNMFYGLSFNAPSPAANNIGVLLNTSQLNAFYSNFWICKAGNELSVPAGSKANTSYAWVFHQQNSSIVTSFPGPIEAIGVSGQSGAGFQWRYAGNLDMKFQWESATAYVLRTTNPNYKVLSIDPTTGFVKIGEQGLTTITLDSFTALSKDLRRSRQTPTETVLVSGVDATSGEIVSVTLTAARLVGAPTNPFTGQYLTFELTQGGAGGFAVTWNAIFKKTWADTGNTTGKISAITFYYNGTNWVQSGAQAPYV